MRKHTLLSLALLGLLLWAACTHTHAQDTNEEEAAVEVEGDDEEEAPKKEKSTEIEEERDVMVLHIFNFERALSENQFLLVEFYAPWCGHCKRLEPVFAEAAAKAKEEEQEGGVKLRLAKVDAIEEKELSDEFDVSGFPALKLFVNGDRKQPVDYTGKRSAEGIVQWMKRRSGPGAPVLDSAESAAQFIEAHQVSVIGFVSDVESEEAGLLKEAFLDMTDTQIALTVAPEVFNKYEVKGNSVVLFKKFDDGRADLLLTEDEALTKDNLTRFIQENSMELIVPFKQETADKIFTSNILLHSLLFINSSVESHTALVDATRPVAKGLRGKMLFIVIDVTASLSHVLSYFGVSAGDAPTARVINMETQKKFAVTSGDLTAESLGLLCQEVIDGTAKPYYRTESVPEDWNKGPVTVLVGNNFESVALDPTKNVFVEFYAPWCGHCKELTPIWEKLGEKYADQDDIIIAKMDATANELESVNIQGFPTLKYFPAGGKEAVDYTGNRDLETLSKFLDAGGVLPKEESDEDDADEDDDDDDDAQAEDMDSGVSNTTSKDEL